MFHSRCLSIETALRSQIEDLKSEKQTMGEQIEGALERERALNDKLFAVANPAALRAMQISAQAAEYPMAAARPMPAVTRRGGLATFHDPTAPQRSRDTVRPALTPEAERFRPTPVSDPDTEASI